MIPMDFRVYTRSHTIFSPCAGAQILFSGIMGSSSPESEYQVEIVAQPSVAGSGKYFSPYAEAESQSLSMWSCRYQHRAMRMRPGSQSPGTYPEPVAFFHSEMGLCADISHALCLASFCFSSEGVFKFLLLCLDAICGRTLGFMLLIQGPSPCCCTTQPSSAS